MANVWSESDLNAFETTIFATGIPSLFGTVFLLGSALLFPELRVFPARYRNKKKKEKKNE